MLAARCFAELRGPQGDEAFGFGVDVGDFEVDVHANKVQIKQAVEAIWPVKVAAVNTMIMPGKQRSRGNSRGYRPDWKKALVSLRAGDRIEFFDGLL